MCQHWSTLQAGCSAVIQQRRLCSILYGPLWNCNVIYFSSYQGIKNTSV